ncbi:menaquinone biosynthesis protein [Anaerobacillus sp. MEB173]|uniref:menaquinone biosynthesis protein n=1 Tax=Anaerobacillus sp. MEB173 TaxID=3383345 RepID=UPI003F914198
MSLVVGEISYTNILPLFFYLDRKKLNNEGCSFVPQIPAKLNEAMENGTVSLGGISSFAYAQNADKFSLMPNLSVSSYGAVGSIFLFSKLPIEQLNGKKIALTSTSATSVNLLKIILGKFNNLSVTYKVMSPNYKEMMSDHDACLLIGDDAILTSWENDKNIYRYDLGELWHRYTGYPMTFAVLAVRNEVLTENDKLISLLYEGLLASKKQSIEEKFQPMITHIKSIIGGSSVFWENYFSGLCYDFSKKQQEGLIYYYRLAYELGLIPKEVKKLSICNMYDLSHSI